jgi:hypothetical protein
MRSVFRRLNSFYANYRTHSFVRPFSSRRAAPRRTSPSIAPSSLRLSPPLHPGRGCTFRAVPYLSSVVRIMELHRYELYQMNLYDQRIESGRARSNRKRKLSADAVNAFPFFEGLLLLLLSVYIKGKCFRNRRVMNNATLY